MKPCITKAYKTIQFILRYSISTHHFRISHRIHVERAFLKKFNLFGDTATYASVYFINYFKYSNMKVTNNIVIKYL